jgi:mechanosensitive ion channel-like protein
VHQLPMASINFSQGVTDAWSAVARFIPKFIGFLVILAIGWFISRLLARALDVVLRKVGFERMAERGGISRALANSKYDTTGLVCKVVYYALLLVTLQLAIGVFGTNPVSTMINGVVAWLPRGLVAIAIVVVAAFIARAVRDLVGSALSSLSYGNVLATLASVFILGIGIIAALGQAGIATTITGPILVAVLAAIVGVVVVGVGGGLVMPMRQRWERMLDSAERDARTAVGGISAYQQGRSDAMSGRAGMTTPTPAPAMPPGMTPGSPDNPPMG